MYQVNKQEFYVHLELAIESSSQFCQGSCEGSNDLRFDKETAVLVGIITVFFSSCKYNIYKAAPKSNENSVFVNQKLIIVLIVLVREK